MKDVLDRTDLPGWLWIVTILWLIQFLYGPSSDGSPPILLDSGVDRITI